MQHLWRGDVAFLEAEHSWSQDGTFMQSTSISGDVLYLRIRGDISGYEHSGLRNFWIKRKHS